MFLKWKKKLQLGAIMSGVAGGRTIEGGRRALRRLRQRPQSDGGVTLGLMTNLMARVAVAEQLSAATLDTVGDTDLLAALALMKKEGVELPDSVRLGLFTRRIGRLIAAAKYDEILVASNPFVGGDFVETRPALGSLNIGRKQKMSRFTKVVSNQSVVMLISQGSGSSTVLERICGQILELIEGVDIMDLADSEAMMLSQWSLAALGLKGTICTSVDMGVYEEPPGGSWVYFGSGGRHLGSLGNLSLRFCSPPRCSQKGVLKFDPLFLKVARGTPVCVDASSGQCLKSSQLGTRSEDDCSASGARHRNA